MSESEWRSITEKSFMEGFNNGILLGERCERIKVINELRALLSNEPETTDRSEWHYRAGLQFVIELLEKRNV